MLNGYNGGNNSPWIYENLLPISSNFTANPR